MATKKDYLLVLVIGIAVGLFVQPILSNTILDPSAENSISNPSLIRILVFFAFAFLAPFALFVASWIGKKIPVIYQFAKFAAVGSLNSFIDLGIFNTLSYFLITEAGKLATLPFFAFKSISFLAATTNSYFWNKNWTFGDKDKNHASTVFTFYAITATTYLLSTGVATGINAIGPFVVSGEVWSNVVAPICGIFTALFINFTSYKFIVFRKKAENVENRV